MVYPPGIPFIVPGERISGELVEEIIGLQEMGFDVRGVKEGEIEVLVSA